MAHFGKGFTMVVGILACALLLLPPVVWAETVDELKQELIQLEQTMNQQIKALEQLIQHQEAARQAKQEEEMKALEEKLREEQQAGTKGLKGLWTRFFDNELGAEAENEGQAPLGKDIQGNVYSSDKFKVRLGGSLRTHYIWQDTLSGDQINKAPLPPGPGEGSEIRDNFRISARRSRFNLAFIGPEALGGKTLGFFEFDFDQGDGTNPNAHLRHAFARWIFEDGLTAGDSLTFTLGQTTNFAAISASTIDANTMKGGLGATGKRNPRAEAVWRIPLDEEQTVKGLISLGIERPFISSEKLNNDNVGAGELGGVPVVSLGTGIETRDVRVSSSFGWQRAKFYVRGSWGQFDENFGITGCPGGSPGDPLGKASDTGAFADLSLAVAAANGITCSDPNKTFSNWAAQGGIDIIGLGTAKKGRAGTFRLKGNAVYFSGDAQFLSSSYDSRLFLEGTTLNQAGSVGGFINPMYFITDKLSVRWAGGAMFALDAGHAGKVVVAGNPTSDFVRDQNYQSELSLWWTPGPWTFGIAWNYTNTLYQSVDLTEGGRRGQNQKIEAITWLNF
jgi:hypothetical protein